MMQAVMIDVRTGKVTMSEINLADLDQVEGPDPVPQRVSRLQARLALLDAGLLADVETALSGADVVTQMAWAEAVEFRRNSPTVESIAAELGLTDGQIDDLFRYAAKVEV